MRGVVAAVAVAAMCGGAYVWWRSVQGTYAVRVDQYAQVDETSLLARVGLPPGVTPVSVEVTEDAASVTIAVRARDEGDSITAVLVYVPVTLSEPLAGREVRDVDGITVLRREIDASLPVLSP